MKQIKFLSFLMMGIIACLGMTSCGDDDDDDNDLSETTSALIGTWQTSYYDDGETVTETFTFKKNGTFQTTFKCPHESYKTSGTYSVSGDIFSHAIITMEARDVDGEWVRVVADAYITNNTLVMTNDENETYRYTRK